MSKLLTEENKTIESYWMNLKQNRKDLKYREWELLENNNTDTNTGGGKSNRISDTTARKAIILAEDKKYQSLKEKISAVESVMDSLDNEMSEFVSVRYFSNDAPYLDWEDVAIELGIGKPKAFKLRNKLIDMTAGELGWL